MTDHYTAQELADDLGEDVDDVERVLAELEDDGVVRCVDGEHWDVSSLPAALLFVSKNAPPVRDLRNRL